MFPRKNVPSDRNTRPTLGKSVLGVTSRKMFHLPSDLDPSTHSLQLAIAIIMARALISSGMWLPMILEHYSFAEQFP